MKKICLLAIMVIVCVSVSAEKKQSEKYIEKRTAAIQEMDSILKYGDKSPWELRELADKKCKEFKKDPVLMRAIASAFATRAGLIEDSKARYREIKRKYPKDFESYSDYAATLFDYSIKVNPNGSLTRDPEYFDLAKAQMDSAKVVFRNSKAPYLWWLNRCVRYAYNDAMVKSFQDEVEAYRKAFPDENADYEAAKIMGDSEIEMNMINFDNVYDPVSETSDKLRLDAEYHRRMLAQKYYDKVDINRLPAEDLSNICYYYYISTESKYLGRDDRALLHEKGLDCAKVGIESFPDKLNVSRFQLWHAAELTKTYDLRVTQAKRNRDKKLQAKETAKRDMIAELGLSGANKLMSNTDTLLRQDYFFAGIVNQYSGKYDEAVKNYKKAVGPLHLIKAKLPYKAPFHNCDSISIYQNLADCYSNANRHNDAITQLNALYNLRNQHGKSKALTDFMDLVTEYRAIGNDTLKTQKERFEALVTADSLYACIQDSIDAGSENFIFTKGFTGYYTFQRMQIRNMMGRLSDYQDREIYLPTEMAADIVRKVEPVAEKSDRETSILGMAALLLWRDKYNNKDYKACLEYQDLITKYDPDAAELYKKPFEHAKKQARKQ